MTSLAYIQITNFAALVAIVGKKKNETMILDVFSFDIQNYVNENGLLVYPLTFAEDLIQSIQAKYPIDEAVLIMSVKDAILKIDKTDFIPKAKDIREHAKSYLEQYYNRPSAAFEVGWIHTGDVLDDGISAAYSSILYSCYPIREIKKLTKVFHKYNVHIRTVYLPEMTHIALYDQYISDYTDPNTLLIESGFSANANGYTTFYEYKRNVLTNFKQDKQGFYSIITAIQNFLNLSLSFRQVYELLLSCGVECELAPEDAFSVLEMHNITPDVWYQTVEKAMHPFGTILNNEVHKQMGIKYDVVFLSGPLADIPGIEHFLMRKYSVQVKKWKLEHEVRIANTTFLYTKGDMVPCIYSGVISAVYFEQYMHRVKNGTFSPKIIDFNWDKNRKPLIVALGATLVLGVTMNAPNLYQIYKIEKQIEANQESTNKANALKQEIQTIQNNLLIQESFIEKSKTSSFDLKTFLYNSTLLKPAEVTIISIDTSNFIDGDGNTDSYYLVKKAVEAKRLEAEGTGIYDPYSIDVTGKDWTFNLPWTDVELTESGIEKYLEENEIKNVNEYVVSKVVIRGYGPVSAVARYSKDLESTANISRVDVVGVESKKINDGSGAVIDTNVFEFNVWFGNDVAVDNFDVTSNVIPDNLDTQKGDANITPEASEIKTDNADDVNNADSSDIKADTLK